jgi:fructose 1,6-bisphosphatase
MSQHINTNVNTNVGDNDLFKDPHYIKARNIAMRAYIRKHVTRALEGKEESPDPLIAAAKRLLNDIFPARPKSAQQRR